mmetsp:Transcript_24771/g.84825  ORF Transcript_24771/g.84825 Transcript_24771/m.84825 type:complete len:822 (+) Transcript_24771:2374-4839(+)
MRTSHHLQACYIWWYLTDKDPLIIADLARKFMDGTDGIWTQKGSKQQEQRWQVDARAAARFLKLLDSKRARDGKTFFPGFASSMATYAEGYKKSMWEELARMTVLPELRVGLEWEGEFDAVYFAPQIDWARSSGPFYEASSFRMNELPHHLLHTVMPFFARLFEDVGAALPKTATALEKVPQPTRDVMRAQLADGALASYLEMEKLHQQTLHSPISFMLLCSPEFGPAAARALASVLDLVVPEAPAAPPLDSDDFFVALYTRDVEVAQWFKQLGLLSAVREIVAMTHKAAVVVGCAASSTAPSAPVWHAWRAAHPRLYVIIYRKCDVHAVSNFRTENTFTKVTTFNRDNLSESRLDRVLRYLANELPKLREARKSLSGDSTGARKGDRDTEAKVRLEGVQMLQLCARYSAPAMAELQRCGAIKAVRSYHKQSTRTQELEIAKLATLSMQQRAAACERVALTDEQLIQSALPGLDHVGKAFSTLLDAQGRAEVRSEKAYAEVSSKSNFQLLEARLSFELEARCHYPALSRAIDEDLKKKGRPTAAAAPTAPKDLAWVYCSAPGCEKWRWLADDVVAGELTEKWICNMNDWDVDRAHCSVAEQTVLEAEDSALALATASALALAAAKALALSQEPAAHRGLLIPEAAPGTRFRTKGHLMGLLFGNVVRSERKPASVEYVTLTRYKVGDKAKVTIDGMTFIGAEVTATLAARGRNNKYKIRLKKLMLTAIQLGHVQLVDLIDKFVGAPRLRRVMILPRSAHCGSASCSGCCLGSKSAASATDEAIAARERTAFLSKLRAATGVALPRPAMGTETSPLQVAGNQE